MAIFRPYRINYDQLESIPIKDGQIIFVKDRQEIYLDDENARTLTLSNTTYEVATQLADGLLSKEDKKKLDEVQDLAAAYTDQKVAELVNGAPETLDTLKEVADAIEAHKDVTDALNSAIGNKLSKTGDASNTMASFTQATTRANIASGEKLSVIFGKIMKWFVDLKSVAFSGNYNDLSNKPTSLPANGGTAETISEILPIEKGGTGGDTKKAVNDIVATGSSVSDPATFSENDRFLWVYNDSSVVKSRFITLINYIKSKCNSVYLQLTGGTMTGTINSSKTTGTHLAGNRGEAIINSTAGAGGYTVLDKLNSTNGFFTDGVWDNRRTFQYTAKSTVDAGTDTYTKAVTLLDEAGNTKFPGTVTAPRFAGTADVATVSKQGKSYIVGSNSGNAPTKPWYKVAECSITSSFIDPTCVLLVHDSYSGNSRRFIGMIKVHFRSNEPPTGDTSVVDLTWIFKTYQLPENLFGLVRTNITNGVKFTLYINISAGNYHSFDISVLSNTSRDTDGHYFIFADNLKANGDLASITPTGNTQVVSSGYGYLVANKLGTSTVGAVSRPIYLNGGMPTPIGNSIGLVDGITSRDVISIYDDGDTANNGGNLLIRGGGNLFIGSGESPENLYNTYMSTGPGAGENWDRAGENCYITADGEIYFITNCQNNSRKGLKFSSDNNYMYIKPFKNSEVIIGEEHLKLRGVYADTFYGNLIGTAKYATALEDMYGTLIAEVSNTDNYKCIKIGDNTNNLSLGLAKTTIAGEDTTIVRLKANGTDFFTYGPLNASKEIRMFADLATFEIERFYLHADRIAFSGGSPGGNGSFSQGYSSQSTKEYSNTMGYAVVAGNFASSTRGKYNTVQSQAGSASNTTGVAFVIGNGTSISARSNAFSVQYSGVVKAKSTITGSTTADYAEYFEWRDGNLQNEDRVGLFVTINEEKISIADSSDDYILGIVSGEPFVLGNGDCDTWNGMFLRDDFGRTIYERAPMVKYNEETKEEELQFDEDGNLLYYGTRPVLNPKYNPDEPYVSRQDRPEWAPIGMLGVLSVKQDGTITQPNTYATVGENGFATLGTKYNENHYRVIKVISPKIVKVIFK